MSQARLYACVVAFVFCSYPVRPQDLSRAVILQSSTADSVQSQTVSLLREEVAKRSGITWPVKKGAAGTLSTPTIVIARRDQLKLLLPSGITETSFKQDSNPAEGFTIETVHRGKPLVIIAGNDDRGMLFGVGYLLRKMEMRQGSVALSAPLHLTTAPEFAVRGHQLGYRFKNNTYDGWTVAMFEQYIRDLAVFGANTIELLPPHTDDAPSSPLFPEPAMQTMIEVSGILKKYGLRCSVYYPAVEEDYSNPETIKTELANWAAVFSKLPLIDELFIPGGDPGHTDPTILFPFLARIAPLLHKYHPNATIWVSAQGFDAKEYEEFYSLLAKHPEWLTGVVFGPQSRDSFATQRARVPAQYPIRFYPDIAHSTHSQFPVPEWDEAYALTEGREGVNPRPAAETTIFRHFAQYETGFVTYSEGVNDDVNKFIWSGLGWSQKVDPRETLLDYSRYFIGPDVTRSFTQAIFALESNWSGPLLANKSVDETYRQFKAMEAAAGPQRRNNWRMQLALYRAYYDEYTRRRLIAETAQQQQALTLLAQAPRVGSKAAVALAAKTLDMASSPDLQPLHARIEELAGELFASIRMQLSVTRYHASAIGRGANLDTLDVPLNNRLWMEDRFRLIQQAPTEAARLAQINAILHWTDSGPGGFYDNLGNPSAEPHLVRGEGFERDPEFRCTALDGIADESPGTQWRTSAISYIGSLYDDAVHLHYSGLNPSARYRVRIDYAGESYALPIKLVANDAAVLQSSFKRTSNPEIVELPLPANVTATGTLDLRWTRPPGIGGGGRGLQIAEVWLIQDTNSAMSVKP